MVPSLTLTLTHFFTITAETDFLEVQLIAMKLALGSYNFSSSGFEMNGRFLEKMNGLEFKFYINCAFGYFGIYKLTGIDLPKLHFKYPQEQIMQAYELVSRF